MRFYINSISMAQYYNIQKPEEGAGLVAYSGKTSMSSVGQKTLDKTSLDSNQTTVVENFDFSSGGGTVWSNFSQPQFDMSSSLLNFPQGHPLYVPQTLAETYSSDTKSLVDMEEMVMGFALIGGITIMIVGLLISKGVVGPSSGAPPSPGP